MWTLDMLQAQKLEGLEAAIRVMAEAAQPQGDDSDGPPERAQAASGGLCASRDKYEGSILVQFSLPPDPGSSLQATGNSRPSRDTTPPPEEAEVVSTNGPMTSNEELHFSVVNSFNSGLYRAPIEPLWSSGDVVPVGG